MFAKMVNMAKTPEDVKKEVGEYNTPSPVISTSAYPYGLCISLDDETLKKLGINGDMPTVGEVLQFSAIAKVTCASVNEREKADGSKEECRRVELQITDMGVPDPDPAGRAVERSEQRRKRFYGDRMVSDNDNDGE